MTVPKQPYRQVHLDFHTALQVEGVGKDFDPAAFAAAMKAARVNSVNIFAKCHHGYSYYPTRVGTQHPHLKIDLLGQQIEALHQVGIRCPIYYTIKWDDLAGIQHPDWVIVDRQGKAAMRTPLSGEWGWTSLDVASGYADYTVAQTEELLALYDVDGFWFDICFTMPNYSAWAQDRMRLAGVNLADDAAVWRYAEEQDKLFFERMSRVVRAKRPDATIFYNGTVNPAMRRMLPYQTHFEIESLPTSGGAWGYLHYPIAARQARAYGQDILGMTGRFHKSWGDFGGLKTQDQLDYECGTIVAAGGRICVGDQLHPRGELDPAVYRLMGKSFTRIEALEPWLEGAVPATEIAILALGKPAEDKPGIGAYSPEVEGAAQAFLETGLQFDIIDAAADLSKYAALYLPDGAALEDGLATHLEAYLAQGGKLALSGTAGYDPVAGQFQLKEIPVTLLGLAPTIPSYLRLGDDPWTRPPWGFELAGEEELASDYDYVFYEQAYRVLPAVGSTVQGEVRGGLFNRAWDTFTSHAQAPVDRQALVGPLTVRLGNVLYFSAPLFGAYRNHDYWAYRAIARAALRGFMPPTLLKPRGPGWSEFTLHKQGQRLIVHVVNYHPRRSSQAINHVDQSWATSGLGVEVRLDGFIPTKAYLAPGRDPLAFTIKDGYAKIDLPPVGTHAVLVLE